MISQKNYRTTKTRNGRALQLRLSGTPLAAEYKQFGTQVKFRWSRDHNNRTADNAFSAPWYYSEMQLEPVAG